MGLSGELGLSGYVYGYKRDGTINLSSHTTLIAIRLSRLKRTEYYKYIMNGQLLVLLCLGAMLAMVMPPALASPVRTDASGRVVITHSKASGPNVADGSEVSSGSGSGGDFDFDGEGPWSDDEDADCDNSTTTEPESEPEATTEPESEPEGSGASAEGTDQPEGSGEESEVSTEATGTTEETTTVTDKPEPFRCPATYKNYHYLFPVPGDCNAFYQCDGHPGGYYWVKKCPPGLAFHSDYQVCVRPKAYELC